MQITPLITFQASLLTFCLGLWLGHRLNLGRERRKELNEAINAVRPILLAERDRPSPYDSAISRAEADLIEHRLPIWYRARFRKALARYKQCKQDSVERDKAGGVFYQNTDAIVFSVNELLRLLKPRY